MAEIFDTSAVQGLPVGQTKEPLVTTQVVPQTNGEVKTQANYTMPPDMVGIASEQAASQAAAPVLGGGVESAACRAGDWQYLFFNRENAAEIDFYRVSEKTRTPVHYYVNLKTVDPKTKKETTSQKLSSGGAIAAVYIKKTDCVQLYYISKPGPGKRVHRLAEVTLVNASKKDEPTTWIPGGLMRKNIAIDKESFLCATLDDDQNPHAYYQGDEELDSVSGC